MTKPSTCAVMAAAATCATAPLVRASLVRCRVLDVPNQRSSHTVSVVRGGGLACIAGAVLTGLTVVDRGPARAVVAVVGLALVGLIDDSTGGVPVLPRLVGQCLMGALVGSSYGPGTIALGVVVMPTLVNVVNFMDGVNGITSMTCMAWGVSAIHAPAADIATLGALVAGLGAGFLPWNAPVPLMFLGDTGSYFFGSLMACGLLHAARNNDVRPTFVVMAPLLPYLADAAQAIARRAARGERITEAHRDHVYQRLVDHHGFSHLQAAGLHAAAAGLCATAARIERPWATALASLAPVAAYLSAPRLLGGDTA